MSPKKAPKDLFDEQPAPKAKAKGKAKAKAKSAPNNEGVDGSELFSGVVVSKGQQADFVNSLKRENAGDSAEVAQAKQEVLAHYEGLALRGPKKKEIVTKWLADKSLSWKNEVIKISETASEKSRQKSSGHLTIYEVAKKIGLDPEVPAQKELLDKVLEEYDQDDDWDEDDPYERGCKRAGLKRITFSKKDLSKDKTTQRDRTTLLSVKDAKSKMSIAESSEEQVSEPSVRIRHPEYIALRGEMDILSSGEGRLTEAISEIKKLLPRLRKCQNAEDRIEECQKMQKNIEDMQSTLLSFLIGHEDVKAEDSADEIKNLLEEAKEMKSVAVKLHENFRLLQKKVQAYIAAQ